MIVHHTDCLHEGIADRRSDKVKSPAFEVFAHRVRFLGARRNLLERLGRVHSRLASDELPDVGIEAAEFFLHAKERLRILNCGCNLEFVANDARVAQQLLHLAPVIERNASRIESIERLAIVAALVEDRIPAQSGLSAFENEELEEPAIVVQRNAPLLVVIANRQLVVRPCAADELAIYRAVLCHFEEKPSPQRSLGPQRNPRYSRDFGSDLFTGDFESSSETSSC